MKVLRNQPKDLPYLRKQRISWIRNRIHFKFCTLSNPPYENWGFFLRPPFALKEDAFNREWPEVWTATQEMGEARA